MGEAILNVSGTLSVTALIALIAGWLLLLAGTAMALYAGFRILAASLRARSRSKHLKND